jgi:hypothetical protein
MKKTQLAKAIAFAITGAALTAGSVSTASAATTMYNTYNAFATATPTDGVPPSGAQPTTDGWVWGKLAAPGAGANPGFVGINGSSTVSTSTPFSYTGGGIVNWGIHLTSATDSGVISQADAFTNYGVYADIDTAKGAWSDATLATAGGWRHNTDIGLFKSDVSTDVKLSIQGLTQSNTDFGFTIFKGMDTSTTAYGHHGQWNQGNNATGLTALSLLGGGTTFTLSDIVAYSVGGASTSNLNDIIFHAEAGQVYTIALGGYRNGKWGDTADGYVMNVAAVPLPAAVWLFGSAVAGFFGIGRRKKQIAA